jgi:Tfp pilus assembly protein PilF
MGQTSDAIKRLEENAERNPADRETLSALVSLNRETGNTANALKYGQQLARISPNEPGLARIIRELEESSRGARP